MATLRRFLKETKQGYRLYVRYRVGTEIDCKYPTDWYLPLEAWNEKDECLRQNAYTTKQKRDEIKRTLRDLEDALPMAFSKMKDDGIIKPTSLQVKKYVESIIHPNLDEDYSITVMMDRFMQSKQSVVAVKTMASYVMTFSYLKEWLRLHSMENYSIGAITKENCIDIYNYLCRKISTNSASSITDKIIAFFNWCVENEIIAKNPFHIKRKAESYLTPYYLTWDEVKQINSLEYQKKAESRKRDMFVFQCCTGMRYCDLISVKTEQIIKDKTDKYWLIYIPKKTKGLNGRQVEVPLNKMAEEIYHKHAGSRDVLFTRSYDLAQYNLFIKRMMEKAGINRKVTVREWGTGRVCEKPLHEVASSHLARRTFVGNLYKKVKDPNLIGSMSGHVEGSAAFNRYRAIDNEMKLETINLLEE